MRLFGVTLLFCYAASTQPLAFEAASIKPTKAVDNHTTFHSTPGMLTMTGYTLRGLIVEAYNVGSFQVLGGPTWMDDDRYDIIARAEGPAKWPAIRPLLRTLVDERFKLVVHRDSRPYPGYGLVVTKKGLRIQPLEGATRSSMNNQNGGVKATGVTMDRLAEWLARRIGAPVSNQTHLAGAFDFTLNFTGDERPDPSGTEMPPIFSALEEQLGLKLELRKLAIEMIVIENAEKASEN
jgi:uncharacterized protein (TIGR03435 family)